MVRFVCSKKMERHALLKMSALSFGKCFQSTIARQVITTPLKSNPKTRNKLVNHQKEQLFEKSYRGNTKTCIVACKNSSLNHFFGQTYGWIPAGINYSCIKTNCKSLWSSRKFGSVPLASQDWDHRRSNGDYFVINSHGPNPSLSADSGSFDTFKLDNLLIEALNKMGCFKPTLVQKLAIKPVMRGENCLIAAETGSGKTLSYLAPIIQNICDIKKNIGSDMPPNTPLALIITPGRELCEQITSVCNTLIKHSNIPLICHHVTGGRLKQKMLYPEARPMDILIGSFGAISKLTTTKVYNLSRVQKLVLDEADTLLDDSFNEKLVHFLRKFPLQMEQPQGDVSSGVQLIMASATMPRSAEEILAQVVPFNSFSKITTERLHRLLPHVPQKFVRLSHLDKPAKLLELVKKDTSRKLPLIIFSNKAERCDWVSMFLNENGIPCTNLNGTMSQHFRENRFEAYCSGKYLVLSCTDVVSRGLDTINTHHVINYDVPTNISDYIHRCGRVGRIGSHLPSGLVTTLICHASEADLVRKIEFAARKMGAEDLPNVNANIKRLISNQQLKQPDRYKWSTCVLFMQNSSHDCYHFQSFITFTKKSIISLTDQ